jgi:predicted transcriptional regulator
MPSLTVKLPGALGKKLRAAARKRGEKLSTLTRRALEKEVAAAAPDFARLAANYKGMFTGPSDLSTRAGYGR